MKQINPPKLEEFDEVSFKINQEPWLTYQLRNTTTKVKLRWILTRLFARPIEDNKVDIVFKSQNITVITDIPKKQYNDNITTPVPHHSQYENYRGKDVGFDIIYEDWNEYEFEYIEQKFILRVKLTLIDVAETSIVTQEREPMYLIRHDTAVLMKQLKE